MLDAAREVYPVVSYAYASVPTYPSGQIGFVIASNDATLNPAFPRVPNAPDFEETRLRYYNSEIHKAAFVLPNFVKKAIGGCLSLPQQ